MYIYIYICIYIYIYMLCHTLFQSYALCMKVVGIICFEKNVWRTIDLKCECLL